MSKLLQKKALDAKDLPGYGKTEKPQTPEEAAKMLGLELFNADDVEPYPFLGGGNEFEGKIMLVGFGPNSSAGLAGSAFHFDNVAYHPNLVIFFMNVPILVMDPSQDDLTSLSNIAQAMLPEWEKKSDQAESIVYSK